MRKLSTRYTWGGFINNHTKICIGVSNRAVLMRKFVCLNKRKYQKQLAPAIHDMDSSWRKQIQFAGRRPERSSSIPGCKDKPIKVVKTSHKFFYKYIPLSGSVP